MRKVTALKALAVAGAMLLAGPAMAATPVTDGTGTLTGATGVVIGGTTYNVEFLDGTCTGLFGGCDAVSDFTFQTQTNALAAANALLAQVFLGTFDTDPTRTRGCTLATLCVVAIPYGLNGGQVSYAGADNGAAQNGTETGTLGTTADLGQQPVLTWARFSLAATAVPEPASWAMMLLGFAGIGIAARRRGRTWSPAA